MTADRVFLDEMNETQAHNLAWFKQVVGPAWPIASRVIILSDDLLRALPKSNILMAPEKVWAVTALIHSAKRAAATGFLSFSRCQMMESQPLFRRYLECIVFARIAWTDTEDAAAWLKGVESESAYSAYKERFGRDRFRDAMRELDPSLKATFDGLSKGTHSSFRSMAHTMSEGGDEDTLVLGVHYFDVIEPAYIPRYVELFMATVSFFLLCMETWAVRTFTADGWEPSWKAWVEVRTPVLRDWLTVEEELRRRYKLTAPTHQTRAAPPREP